MILGRSEEFLRVAASPERNASEHRLANVGHNEHCTESSN